MTRRESTTAEESAVGLKFFYRPGAAADSPLVVLVHGRAGNRGVMWTFERSIPTECHVVSFEAFLPDPLGGWSWWEMTAGLSNREAIVYAAHKLRGALQAFVTYQELQPKTSLGIGFSQGSALVSASVSLGLIPFDAIGILAGFVFLPDEEALPAKLPRVFIAHGTQDDTISVEKARRGAQALRQLGAEVHYVEEDVGHKVGIQGSRALKQWIAERVSS